MHMPDGIIPLGQAIIYIVISGIMILIALWQSRSRLTMKQIPVVGVLAAGLFAAQMFNFPVPFGSSGHLIGTALATTLVGPWVAILILCSILIVQAMFGDGGILAFGVNSLNMAIIGAFTTFAIFYFMPKKWTEDKKKVALFSGIAGFVSAIVMATFASIELSLAQAGPAGLIFSWMLMLHTIIGVAEGLITFTIVFFLFRAEPALFEDAKSALYLTPKAEEQEPTFRIPIWAGVASFAAFAVMAIFGIVASENPDGLERTFEALEEQGIKINVLETGFLGFPEGIGWDILQMAIVMFILFFALIGISYLIYRIRLFKFQQHHKAKTVESKNDNS
ncbi:MAG: energy-coupling factor ABC transporter permease [Candidatus Heimdallarchaeaceae archaeon]